MSILVDDELRVTTVILMPESDDGTLSMWKSRITNPKFVDALANISSSHRLLNVAREPVNSQPDQAVRIVPGKRRTIHILGVGNLGRLYAHSLASQPNPPKVTLLFHRSSLSEEWERAGRKIEVITDGFSDRSAHVGVELLDSPDRSNFTGGVGQEPIIKHLIVTTKTINTTAAISAVRHRLSSDSTIAFTQNGMGTVDEVTEKVFKDVLTRPNYIACVTSHGVFSQGPFRSVHAGFGTVAIGRVESQPQAGIIDLPNPLLDKEDPVTSRYLVDTIVNTPVLAARKVSSAELLRLQLEKLVMNAMINPLTAIFNCRNGTLFRNPFILRLMRVLLAEATHVIQSLPELQNDHNTRERFSLQRLDGLVLDVAEKTAENVSSMLQDVRAGRQTEIDYINGYIVRRGKAAGIACVNNEKLVEMVKEGRVITHQEISRYFSGSCFEQSGLQQ